MLGPAGELRDGVDPLLTIESLERRRAEAKSTIGRTSFEQIRDAYLRWAEETQQLLQHSFADPLLPLSVVSQRYWQIRELTSSSTQPYPVVSAEIDFQDRQLELIVEGLRRTLRAIGTSPGLIAVLDTNVLLHHKPIADLPWTDVLGTRPVRLLLPLRVIQELDEKKWTESDKLRKRARRIVPDLAKLLAARQLSADVTIEAPVLSGATQSRDADQDILETCLEIRKFTSNELRLVTGDLGMTVRAEALGLKVVAMPEESRRVRDDDPVPTPTTT